MAGDEPSEGAERDASDEPASGEPAGPDDGNDVPEDAEGSNDDEPVAPDDADEGGADSSDDEEAHGGGDAESTEDEDVDDASGEDAVSVEGDDEAVEEDEVDVDGGLGGGGSDASEPIADEERTAELEDIPGVGSAKAEALREAGLSTVADVAAASREELAEVPGIGDVLAARIQADAGEVEETIESDDESGEQDGPSEVDIGEGEVEADVDEDGSDDEVGGIFGGGRSGGPAEDREMPLADHIREMLRRLAVVVAVAGIVSLLAFPFAERIVNFLWYSILPGVESDIARPRLYGVLELLFTKLKVASLAGLIVALPVLVYETYAFMRPGLYPHERRYYLAAIPTSLVLALVGVSFAYFVVLPAIFVYFLYYSQDVATIGFALGRTFDLVLLLMGYMAIVFQIPLFIMLAMMMGLVTRAWLAGRRLLFWGAFLGISFLFSPDPTGMAPVLVAATMIVLFEGTLLLTKWTGRE